MGGEKQVTTMVLKVDLQCCKCYKKVKKILYKIPHIQDQIYDEKNDTVIIKVVCCSPEKIKEKIICKGGDCIKSIEIKVPEKEKCKKPDPEHKPPCQKPHPPPPPPVLVAIGVCCQQCNIWYPGVPCCHFPGWPPPRYECHGYCGKPVDSCGCGRNCYPSHCDTQGCTFMWLKASRSKFLKNRKSQRSPNNKKSPKSRKSLKPLEKTKEPEKPKTPEKPREPEKPKEPEKPNEPEKPPKEPEKPKPPPPVDEKPKDPPPPCPCRPTSVPGYHRR
nr:protein PYRICULARIA ORYZAE RESISTANCE 21-like [Ziziphus jujuba var. spinosa]